MELNTLKPAPGSKHVRKRGCPRHRVGDGQNGWPWHKGRERAPEAFTKWASRAGRCRCSAGCPSAASTRRRGRTAPKCCCLISSRVKAEKIDLAVLKEAGVVSGIGQESQSDRFRQTHAQSDADRCRREQGRSRRNRSGGRSHRCSDSSTQAETRAKGRAGVPAAGRGPIG